MQKMHILCNLILYNMQSNTFSYDVTYNIHSCSLYTVMDIVKVFDGITPRCM